MALGPPGKKAAGHIVVADDVPDLLAHLSEVLTTDGFFVQTAPDGEAALALIREEAPDLVLADVHMPAMDGIELCRQIKTNPATRLTPVVLLTGLGDRSDRIAGINAGADDFLIKPISGPELRARVRSLVRLKRFTDDLDSAESIILSLALTVEARDKYTSGHCQRMAAYAAALGMHLGLIEEEVAALRRGGYLHDVGKVGVPDAILQKPGPLTPEEFAIVKAHTTVGDNLCGSLRLLRLVRPIVRSHHERADGSGYPDGLKGDTIPFLAQIMGIVDVYDALTSNRSYRAALTPEQACVRLLREVDLGWRRRDLVGEFTALCRSGRLDSSAQLEAGNGSYTFVAAVSNL